MAKERAGTPKGMRDFSPLEMQRRNAIFDTIRRVFTLYGYAALETPSMELLSTLLGKYGEEGDKLLYRVLNSGNYLRDVPADLLSADRIDALTRQVADKGLRYDLTVPFARYVAQHWQELPRPFKRYQMQPVWRADRPQKGRYREFYQCDVDVVGSDSLLCELELMQMVEAVFDSLGLAVEIRINNRKVLAGLAERLGHPERLIDMTVAIDKLEKVGREGVEAELRAKGFAAAETAQLFDVVGHAGGIQEQLPRLAEAMRDSAQGEQGVAEIRELSDLAQAAGLRTRVVLDLSLARGLNYYTGAIFEVKALGLSLGSVCGGGRYDNLTGIFGLEGVSGVGISFGADRIYDALLECGLLGAEQEQALDTLFLHGEPAARNAALGWAAAMRTAGRRAMVYPDAAKLRRQMEYANRRGARYVVIAGQEEWALAQVLVKDMQSGTQRQVGADEVVKVLCRMLDAE